MNFTALPCLRLRQHHRRSSGTPHSLSINKSRAPIFIPMKKRSAATATASSSTFSNSSSESSSLTSVESNPKRPKSTIQNPKTKKPSPTRSSVYRGVTRHRWTGRFEAHLWDKESWNSVQTKKGRQVYLGAYDCEEAAARTYDLAAIKYWGPDTAMNFSIEMYDEQIEEMQKLTREEYLATLRRRSSGFSRGVSKFRGVAKHHQNGRWEARIGRVLGNKYLYLGTYSTQEEAAAAYDRAAIQYRGANAVTNFDISNYGELSSEMNPLKVGFGKQEQSPQQLNLKTETNAQEQEIQQHHQPKYEETEHVRYSNAQDSCAMEVMMNEDELSWDLNMNPHFNELTVLNMSDVVNKSGELRDEVLPALFEDYSGFEDDLDFMFSSELKENGEKVDDSRTTVFTMASTSSSSSVTCLSSSPTSRPESYDD